MEVPPPFFDVARATLRGPDAFPRFRITDAGRRLDTVRLPGSTLLLVLERNGGRRALLRSQMAYHHVAQGEADGEPFVVTF
jgi:hypothetical protein